MKRILILLVLSLTLVLSLASCKETPPTPDGDSASESDTEPAAPVEDVSIVKDGATQYTIVRPDEADTVTVETAITLMKAINEKYGISINLGSDFDLPGQERSEYEILVGHTNRDESAAALEGLKYGDSVISVVGKKVVITGGGPEATKQAVTAFIENYLADGELSLAGDLNVLTNAEYALDSLTLDGTPISDVTVVYGLGLDGQADGLISIIGRTCGARLTKTRNASDADGAIIKINKADAKGYAYDDFAIVVKDGNIELCGGSTHAVAMACNALAVKLTATDTATSASLAYTFTLPSRDVYINDINALPLHWDLYYDTPEWMLDFDEKYAAFETPDGRFMSSIHRGDMVDYPENSIEGIISAIRMGADMVEIDPRMTKDGVLVLLHDAKLVRTTNFSEMKGKNGLPTSEYVWDWTYEQLCQLNLREGTGGTSAKVTPYKIPTLEEAIKVCANRMFIRLDRKTLADDTTCAWGYEKDIWPLLVKHNAYTTVMMTWHTEFTNGSYALVKKYRALAIEACGKPMHNVLANPQDMTRLPGLVSNNNLTPAVRGFLAISEKPLSELIKENKSRLDYYKGKYRMYQDAHAAGYVTENVESHEFYAALNEVGVNFILSNKGRLCCSYIAENFVPTKYSK